MDSQALVLLLGYLRGDIKLKGTVEGDTVILHLIEDEMSKLRPTLTREEAERYRRRRLPETHRRELEEVKEVAVQAWEAGASQKGWFHVREIVRRAKSNAYLSHCSEETVSRRVREAADPKVENPTFLFHLYPQVNSGRYRINAAAVRALEPEEKREGR